MASRKRKTARPRSSDEVIIVERPSKRPRIETQSRYENFDDFVKAVENPDNHDTILLEFGDDKTGAPDSLYGRDLATLLPGEWLNDNIMNAFVGLLRNRYEHNNHFFFLNTFFMEILKLRGPRAVMKWFRVGHHILSPFCFENVIIPVHESDHWAVIGINNSDIDTRNPTIKIYYYDSCYDYDHETYADNEYVQRVIRFLEEMFRFEHSAEGSETQKIRICISQFVDLPDIATLPASGTNVPQQENAVDCGVFALMFALRMAQDVEFDFAQKNIDNIRREILKSLWLGRLSGRLLVLRPLDIPESSAKAPATVEFLDLTQDDDENNQNDESSETNGGFQCAVM